MKTFDIVVGKSAGDIVFGMSRDEARQMLGEYSEFKNHPDQMNLFDQFAFCQLGYDKNDKVEFICFHTLKDLEIKFQNRVISGMTGLELFYYINKLDSAVELEEGGVGFISNILGIGAYFEKKPVIDMGTEEEIYLEKMESITIAVPGYWSKYEAK